ncbi:hypothetical protein PIB30_023344 [Stylosanthes scabra]|uniref:Secreted protein n=1 Tax=Stylosanthes scabra TaxID=79078 RepID=A0ABU6T948_9FABA|nr:hypothetical protein [Stylosanthes scabra]
MSWAAAVLVLVTSHTSSTPIDAVVVVVAELVTIRLESPLTTRTGRIASLPQTRFRTSLYEEFTSIEKVQYVRRMPPTDLSIPTNSSACMPCSPSLATPTSQRIRR